MKYNPSLDGIRAIAILAVLAHHYTYRVYGGGAIGVDIFFALSGYLITTVLLREFARTGRIDFRSFYKKRVRRLAPALCCALIIAGLLWSTANAHTPYTQALVPALLYYENWVGVYHEERLGTLAPMWSLSVEEQFYLVWPVLLGVLLFATRRRRIAAYIWSVSLVMSLALMVLRSVLFLAHSPFASYFSTFARMDEILAGAFIATVQHVFGGRLVFFASRWGRSLAWSSAGLLFTLTFFVGPTSPALFLGGFSVVAWLSAGIIAHVENAESGLMARLLASRGLVEIGKRSYGLYVYHMPVFEAFEAFHVRHSKMNFLVLTLLRTAILFGLAWASYGLVERRFLKSRTQASSASPPASTDKR